MEERNIPDNLKRSKMHRIRYVHFTVVINSILPCGVHVWKLARNTSTLVSCLTTLVFAFGLLGCMFGPKAYILLFHSQQNTVECVRVQVSNYSFSSVAGKRVLPKPVNVGIPNSALESKRACRSKLLYIVCFISLVLRTKARKWSYERE